MSATHCACTCQAKKGVSTFSAATESGGSCCGKCAYANFSATVRDCDDFFTDPAAIQHYKRHAERMLMRVNRLTGVAYVNDPTIFGDASIVQYLQSIALIQLNCRTLSIFCVLIYSESLAPASKRL